MQCWDETQRDDNDDRNAVEFRRAIAAAAIDETFNVESLDQRRSPRELLRLIRMTGEDKTRRTASVRAFEQPARDHLSLDFGRALENIQYARIA